MIPEVVWMTKHCILCNLVHSFYNYKQNQWFYGCWLSLICFLAVLFTYPCCSWFELSVKTFHVCCVGLKCHFASSIIWASIQDLNLILIALRTLALCVYLKSHESLQSTYFLFVLVISFEYKEIGFLICLTWRLNTNKTQNSLSLFFRYCFYFKAH